MGLDKRRGRSDLKVVGPNELLKDWEEAHTGLPVRQIGIEPFY